MISIFNGRDWFWIVGADDSKAWSSAGCAYVNEWPEDRVTRIANEIELFDVLSKLGLASKAPSRSFSVDEIRSALLVIDPSATGNAADAPSLENVAGEIGLSLPPLV